MTRSGVGFLLTASLVLAACSREYPNPFAELTVTATPPPDAAVIFAGNGHAASAGAGHELFAAAESGASVTRLTFCGGAERPCDTLEAALAPERERAVMLRLSRDTDGDGRLTLSDGAALVYADLARQAEAELVSATQQVTGVDWSPTNDILVYSAQGDGGEDLFRTTPIRPTPDNAQGTRNLTCPSTPGLPAPQCDRTIRERHPRIDPSGTVAAFERLDATGKSEVWIFQSSVSMQRVTTGGPTGEPLPGTPYVVGSDADPAYSPDGRFLVFRRLTGTGLGGRGAWDILSVAADGTGLATVASGPAWRGAPDWGPSGIVFAELDAAGGAPRLVVASPGGAGRRVLLALPAGFDLAAPRWLR